MSIASVLNDPIPLIFMRSEALIYDPCLIG